MAGLVLRDGARVRPGRVRRRGSTRRTTIGPKWRPRYVRVLRDPPTTGTNKIVKRTLVHQKWRGDRVGGDAVFVRRPRRAGVPAVHRRRRAALHDVVRALPARAVLGPVDVDLALHPRGAGVRRRDPRVARREPRAPAAFDSLDDEIEWGRALAGAARGRPLGRASTGRRSTAGAARRRSQVAIFNMEYARSRALAAGQPRRHQPRRAHAARARHRRAEAALAAGDPRRRARSGASCSASPSAGSDLAALHDRAPSASTAAGCSAGQKVWTSYAQFVAVGDLPRPHRPRRAEARGHLVPRRRHGGRRASRSGRSCRSPARPSSTRCSSTTCSCPTTSSSAGCTRAGRSRTRRSRTSAARSSRSRSRSCTRCTSTSCSRSRASAAELDDVDDRRRARAVVRRAARAAAAQLAHAVAARAGHRARAGVELDQARAGPT